MIEADIDRYGALVRPSYLADYMELLALRGLKSTIAQLGDMVEDRWGLKREIITTPDDDPGESVANYTEAAFACILERREILGDAYPFIVHESHIEAKPDLDIHASPYVALLALTLAHAYKIQADVDVKQAFEEIVAEGLAGVGFTVANVGRLSRENSMDFTKTVQAVSSHINVRMDPGAATRRANANDGGVDVVGHLDWGDGRSGRWTVLGQATCGTSDTWEAKLGEPKPEMWKKMMAESVSPTRFLAVPHHVDERAYRLICENNVLAVVDRSKLVPLVSASIDSLRSVVDMVMAEPIESNQV